MLISNKFIFIVGLHRSGTSLIHRILRSHPEISGFENTDAPEDEGQHLQTVYPPAKAFGGPGSFALHPDAYMDETHALATPENASELFQQWSKYWDTNSQYLIEKSPPSIIRMRFLQQLFPNSYFLIIYRHPLAVSYATSKWSHNSLSQILENSLRSYERAKKDQISLNRSHSLKYEDFVAEPEKHLLSIYQWLALSNTHHNEDIKKTANEKYFRQWQSDKQQNLDGAVQFENTFEQRLNAFGYSFSEIQE